MKRLLLLAMMCLGIASGASLRTITKTPIESFNCGVSFPRLTADGLTLISVTSVNIATGLDSTSVIVDASPAPVVFGSLVVVRVNGGSSKERHLVNVLVSDTVTGEVFEGQFTIAVE